MSRRRGDTRRMEEFGAIVLIGLAVVAGIYVRYFWHP